MNANENASEARAKQVALDTKDRTNRKGRERAEKGESGIEKTGRELSFQGVSFMHKRERRSSRQTHYPRTGMEIRKTHTHTQADLGPKDALTDGQARRSRQTRRAKTHPHPKPQQDSRTRQGGPRLPASPSSSHFTLPARAQKREGRRPCSGPPPAGAPTPPLPPSYPASFPLTSSIVANRSYRYCVKSP